MTKDEALNELHQYATETEPTPEPVACYAVSAGYSAHKSGDWERTGQLPTFYLFSDVQGIRDEAHAESIAMDLFAPICAEGVTLYVTVVKV